jgi:hypothetical protein
LYNFICAVSADGFTAGMLPASAQTLSPRNKSGLGIASLAANLLALISVLVAPYPIFLNRKSIF